jgi:hypothetical protein
MIRSKSDNPFRYFHSAPEVIRLVVVMALSKQLATGARRC